MTTLTSVAAVAAQTLANMTKVSNIYSATPPELPSSNKTIILQDNVFKDSDTLMENGSSSSPIDSVSSTNSQVISALTSGVTSISEEKLENEKFKKGRQMKNNSVAEKIESGKSTMTMNNDDAISPMAYKESKGEVPCTGQDNNNSTGTEMYTTNGKSNTILLYF